MEGGGAGQPFDFSMAPGGVMKRSGLSKGNRRYKSETVAVINVAERARRFIKTAAALDTERFRRCDLDVIDVIAVPKRLEDAVAKAQHEQILHGVLAEVMIDAVDLLFVENVEDNLVQSPG